MESIWSWFFFFKTRLLKWLKSGLIPSASSSSRNPLQRLCLCHSCLGEPRLLCRNIRLYIQQNTCEIELFTVRHDYLGSKRRLFVAGRNYRIMARLISALQRDTREALIAVREMSCLLSMKLISAEQRFSQRDCPSTDETECYFTLSELDAVKEVYALCQCMLCRFYRSV